MKVKREIDEINMNEVQKKIQFVKEKYYSAGGKSLKLVSYKLRKQQAERTINRIKNPMTKEIETTPDKIQQCFEEYYKGLYSQPHKNDEYQMEALLSQLNLPQVTKEQNNKLMSEITQEELNSAIRRLRGGKSPGTDGFTPEWYKTMQEQLVPTLLRTFNSVLKEKVTPLSWRDVIISVIPKE